MKRTKNVKKQKTIDKPKEVLSRLEELKKEMPERRVIFAYEYCRNGWNGKLAYQRSYPGCGERTAYVQSCKILKTPKLQELLSLIKTDYERLCGVSKARQMAEYTKIAYSTLANIHNNWISLKEWETLKRDNPEALAAIESIDTKTIKTINGYKEPIEIEYIRIKLHDKIKALEKIDILMGYNQPVKVEVDADINHAMKLEGMSPDEMKLLVSIARKQNLYENK